MCRHFLHVFSPISLRSYPSDSMLLFSLFFALLAHITYSQIAFSRQHIAGGRTQPLSAA